MIILAKAYPQSTVIKFDHRLGLAYAKDAINETIFVECPLAALPNATEASFLKQFGCINEAIHFLKIRSSIRVIGRSFSMIFIQYMNGVKENSPLLESTPFALYSRFHFHFSLLGFYLGSFRWAKESVFFQWTIFSGCTIGLIKPDRCDFFTFTLVLPTLFYCSAFISTRFIYRFLRR